MRNPTVREKEESKRSHKRGVVTEDFHYYQADGRILLAKQRDARRDSRRLEVSGR